MTTALLGDTEVSDEVLQLVKTVERLGPADQERILRIVTLLALVPGRVQITTKHMLRRLIDDSPNSVYECVDQVIEFLEDHILEESLLADDGLTAGDDTYFDLPMSYLRN